MAGIKTGQLTPLLTWTSAFGKEMVLSGETMESPETGSQWFKRIEITKGDDVVFRASMKEGALQVAQ